MKIFVEHPILKTFFNDYYLNNHYLLYTGFFLLFFLLAILILSFIRFRFINNKQTNISFIKKTINTLLSQNISILNKSIVLLIALVGIILIIPIFYQIRNEIKINIELSILIWLIIILFFGFWKLIQYYIYKLITNC